MTSKTWADVAKGDRVRAAGKVFEVKKIKGSGKKRDVVLDGQGGKIELEVKAKATVDVVTLHDGEGRMTRWASKAEAAEVAKPLLSPGNPAIAKAPKADGPKWSKPLDDEVAEGIRTELGGELIAESVKTSEGYYVPPVDVATVQAHLVTFHGRDFLPESVVTALADHDAEHRAAEAGSMILPINHWHTERRATR